MSRESALSDRSRRVLPPIAEGEKRIESVRPPRLVAHRTASHRFERDGWRPSHCERRSRLLPPATDRGIILLRPDRQSVVVKRRKKKSIVGCRTPGGEKEWGSACIGAVCVRAHSDVEENNAPEVADEVEVSADAPKGQMSVLDALKGVLKLALMHDGLARGLREASKALDRRQAHMCVLNENCEEEAYKKLVVALCDEHKIPLIKVQDGKQLGEWAGLCVLDREGNARKVVNCSCVVVKDWGEESQERSILLNYFQTSQ
ncbi:40S ribosomal protein S12 [Purpureocillium lilacinum]|uniref:40S ribosomal protein S12 n=2 Tax=Ophiocordycipitaceae TaxID=474942 RepID=A0A2U3EJR8_PURLI|nr:hypothetical protein Purlil1_3070 [Purpureocillium lilacinum]PWI74749.1 40S ribosomal protein S12 [Purpureocillium lilacinum]